jgi:nicotinamide-nucleotide amidase
MLPEPTLALARRLIETCRTSGLMLATAESCTGGLIAACLTEIPGSSEVLERGFVTYSNRAKIELLGVGDDLLRAHGAVSEAVARAMAQGALQRAGVDLAVSVTGIAGPGGGTPEKPVGLVHIAAAVRDRPTEHARHVFVADRRGVRAASVDAALALALELASGRR